MKTCNYCGCPDFMIEEETGQEYCTRCGHYTGNCSADENIWELLEDF